MLKKLLYIAVLLAGMPLFTHAQLGLAEQMYLDKLDDYEPINLFIKGDTLTLKTLCKEHQAIFKFSKNNISSIRIEKKYVNDFILHLSNFQVEIPLSKGQLMMDTALIHNNLVDIHNGTSPLTQAYTGKDVVVGILDAGIYFEHDDFKNADGSSRVRFIWDQNVNTPSNPAQPYNYGQEWTWLDINNGACNHVEPANQYGHGTTVAGAASGNGLANGTHKGVAPESDIIAVAIDFGSNNFLGNVADAIDYVFKKADAMGMSCVINTSLGTYYGSHDGKDLSAQLIDALIEERSGRAVVASAGNGNNYNNQVSNFTPTHLSYNVTSDTSFTWFKTISSQGVVYFDLWADTTDFKDVKFALSNDNSTTFEEGGTTVFLSVNDFVGNLQQGIYLTKYVYDNLGANQGTVEMYLEENEGRFHFECLITPINVQDWWRFKTIGSGTFDIWSSATFQGTSNMVYQNLPPNFVVPAVDFYQYPDNKKCIVSSWQCSDKVITVGNYANRAHWWDVDSVYRSTGLTPGEIYYTSSEGPTRDNRLKPDISATGNLIFATGNLDFIASALAVNRQKVSYDTLHNYNGGTSMSSPIVAGAVALYLEKNPDAWWYEIKEALTTTARRDTFTGPTENTHYGYGKLDGFAMMQFEAITGCTDPTSFNYNPNANIDDGSCIPVVYGCIDSTAFNYNPNANTDDGSCIPVVYGCTDTAAFNYDSTANVNDGSCVPFIYGCTDSTASNYNPNANTDDGSCTFVSIKDIVNSDIFSMTPNPAKNYTDISCTVCDKQNVLIQVVDILGKTKFEFPMHETNYRLNVSNYTKGVYLLIFKEDNKTVATKKLIVY